MKSRFLQTLFTIRYSYWFIPSVMAAAAVALAITMVALDVYLLTEIPAGFEWLFRSQPDGARAILSTVAGSTITVAGVVFSMTIMAVSHATSNYGSRLLLKFLKDTQNQITLGTFTATFIYCLLVLRTVSNEASSGSEFGAFVPHLAILGALGLALASVMVLIAFIHHVPDTIHIGDMAADRGRELIGRLDDLFPVEPIANEGAKNTLVPITHAKSLINREPGYLQAIDYDGLLSYCTENGLVVTVAKPAGDFAFNGETLLRFTTPDDTDPSELVDDLHGYFGIGQQRTPVQDTRFLIEELTQIAIRALSPGINDPFTATTCIDWLTGAVASVVNRPPRQATLSDDDGVLRVIMPRFDFSDLCLSVFDELRPYVVADVKTSQHMAELFKGIIDCTITPYHREILCHHAQCYLDESLAACSSGESHKTISEHYGFLSD